MSEQVTENGNLGFHLFHIPYLSFHKSADLAYARPYSSLHERPTRQHTHEWFWIPTRNVHLLEANDVRELKTTSKEIQTVTCTEPTQLTSQR